MQIGMVFAIIFTLILIGFLFAVGFNQIQSFFCIGSNAQTNKAVKDIEAFVDEVFILAKGSGKSYPLSLPSDAKLCFINKTNPGPHPYQDTTKTWNPDSLIIEQFLQNPDSPDYGSNLWIYRCGSPLGEGYTMRFLSSSKSFCALSGTTLFLENTGATVDISFLE